VSVLVPAVFNGIIYGVVVWLAYSILSSATKREKKELIYKCEACGATFTKMEELDEHKKRAYDRRNTRITRNQSPCNHKSRSKNNQENRQKFY
jgi:hypothetical protein